MSAATDNMNFPVENLKFEQKVGISLHSPGDEIVTQENSLQCWQTVEG